MPPVPMNVRPETPPASSEVELASLDLRYENCRMQQAVFEERLLGAIAARGIETPLEGVGELRILLNGFKRYRCARQLELGAVPYRSVGADETAGLLLVLQAANERGLGILEQAAFLDALQQARHLSIAQIALELSRSKAWVSLRLGLLATMSPAVRQKLFTGAFPVYAYMYTLRPFMRINRREVEEFVLAVSGRHLSVREINALAQGFFRGGETLRAEIRQGHVALPLARLKAAPAGAAGGSELERAVLRDLEVMHTTMRRVTGQAADPRLASGAFQAQAQMLTEGIIRGGPAFLEAMRRLHDRSGTA